MAYEPTEWEDFPSIETQIDAAKLNKIENELTKLDPVTSYTIATGIYTTAAWSSGPNNCVWTAPKTGLYIIFVEFLHEDDNANVYKQFQLKGTATRLLGDMGFYQVEATTGSVKAIKFSMPVYAEQGQTIVPYIHTPLAGIDWEVKLLGLFLR